MNYAARVASLLLARNHVGLVDVPFPHRREGTLVGLSYRRAKSVSRLR